MFEHSCKDYHSMHTERIKLRMERICQVKLPSSSFDSNNGISTSVSDNNKPIKFLSKEFDQVLYLEARNLIMNDNHSLPCQDTIEFVLQFKTYEDSICTDLLEEEEIVEVKTILEKDKLPLHISLSERYNDHLDYYDLSESKDESSIEYCQLASEEIYQSFYNPSIVFSTLLEKAQFTKPERKVIDNLVSDELLSEWTLMDSLPINYNENNNSRGGVALHSDSDFNLPEMAKFGMDEDDSDREKNIEEISCDEQVEPIHECNQFGKELIEESNYSAMVYTIEGNMSLFNQSKDLLMSYFSSEMTLPIIDSVPSSKDEIDLFDLDKMEVTTNSKFSEIEHRNNFNMLEEFSIGVNDSFHSIISDLINNPKTVNQDCWCLKHLQQKLEEERTSLFSSDSILNSDDIRTIPCPLLDAKPGPVKIVPIEEIIKTKSTSNIEITLQNLWLSDTIYRSRKQAESFDGKNLSETSWDASYHQVDIIENGTTITERSTERFERESFENDLKYNSEMILKIPNNMAPNSKSRLFAERVIKKLSEIEEMEMDFQVEDLAFVGDLFQQTSVYSETASHYKDNGKGALYKYESLMETLVEIEEFENYHPAPVTTTEKSSFKAAAGQGYEQVDENMATLVVEQDHDSPHLSPIEVTKETMCFNDEILEDNLDAFLTFKKSSLASTAVPAAQHKDKEPIMMTEDEALFLPQDVKVSSKHSQMVKSILTQNSLVVLQPNELLTIEGILLLQKLKNCSSNSMFVHIDGDETRLEQDFRFIRSFLCNHTRNLSMVTKDNFTTKISTISQECKILFISRSIAESFMQRMEKILSKCCLIVYKELVLIEQDQFIPILKFVESMYSISKKNIQTIVMSSVPSRDVSQLSHLLDSTMTKQLLLDSTSHTTLSHNNNITVNVSGSISKFLESIIKVGEFTLSSISGVKGYNFESMKFLNIQSDLLKRIVEEFGTNLKVVLSSNDSKRIIETRSTFKKLVCLHTLKYLFEATLGGGLSVGRAYLEKIKDTDTYRTLLDGAISEIYFQMVKLSNDTEDFSKAQTIVQTAKEQYHGKSKILILSKHNKVLSDIANKFEEGMNIFTLFSLENRLFLKSLQQGVEISFSEGLLKPEPHIYLTTFSNISNIVDVKDFNDISLIIQVEPGEFNDALYSMVCRNVVGYLSISSKLERGDGQLSLDTLNQSWVKSMKVLLKKEKDDLIVTSKLVDRLVQQRKNIPILQEKDIEHLEYYGLLSSFSTKQDRTTGSRIIVTEKCIQNNDLISELESRFSISIVERNSTLFSPADIIVNEKHCVIVYRFKHIDSYREEVSDIFNRILSLSLQFSYCWVIIENYNGGIGYIDSLSFLSSSLLCFTKSLQIELNLRFSYNMDQSAEIINSICMEVMAQSKSLNHDIIWIRERENSQEAFLSKLPSVNFYSAQAIVENYSIKDICRMKSFEEFSQHLGRYFTETGLKLLYNVLFEIFDGFEENNNIITEDEMGEEEQYKHHDNVMEISQDNPSTFSNSFITQPDLSHSYMNNNNNNISNGPTTTTSSGIPFERPGTTMMMIPIDNNMYNQKRLFSSLAQQPPTTTTYHQQEPIFQPFKRTKMVADIPPLVTERIPPPPSPLFQKHKPFMREEQPPTRESFSPMFRMDSFHPTFPDYSNASNGSSTIFGNPYNSSSSSSNKEMHHGQPHQQHQQQQLQQYYINPPHTPTIAHHTYQELPYYYQNQSATPVINNNSAHSYNYNNTWNNTVVRPNSNLLHLRQQPSTTNPMIQIAPPTKRVLPISNTPPPIKLQVPPSDNNSTPRTKIDFNAFKYKPSGSSLARNGKTTKKW